MENFHSNDSEDFGCRGHGGMALEASCVIPKFMSHEIFELQWGGEIRSREPQVRVYMGQ